MAKKNNRVINMLTGIIIAIFGIGTLVFAQLTIKVPIVGSITNLSPKFFPSFASIGLIFFGLNLSFAEYGKYRKNKIGNQNEKTTKTGYNKYLRVLLVAIVLVAYIYLIDFLGFIISTVLALISSSIILGERSWKYIIVVNILITIVSYYFFSVGFRIPLPLGFFK